MSAVVDSTVLRAGGRPGGQGPLPAGKPTLRRPGVPHGRARSRARGCRLRRALILGARPRGGQPRTASGMTVGRYRVLRGGVPGREFIAFWLSAGGRVVTV